MIMSHDLGPHYGMLASKEDVLKSVIETFEELNMQSDVEDKTKELEEQYKKMSAFLDVDDEVLDAAVKTEALTKEYAQAVRSERKRVSGELKAIT